MKHIVVFLGHPAHYHLFKNVVHSLIDKGMDVTYAIKQKDILVDLVKRDSVPFEIIREDRKDGFWGMLSSVVKMEVRMAKWLKKQKASMLIGTTLSFTAKMIMGIPVVCVNEDDADVVPLYAKLSYPFATDILNPVVCNSGKWDTKAIKYASYQELAYLHPNHFTPDRKVVEQYFSTESPYFIIRFAKLKAHHDAGIKGISTEIAQRLIDILKPHGRIYITSERELEPQFEQYRIKINPLDMHHVMAFADLYIGDSQTMAAEAGVLGTPFVRFNDFVGRIGYLRELEDVYHLGYGVKTNEVERLYKVVEEIIAMPNREDVFNERRQKMLSEKIDYAQFLTWFVENYPQSAQTMKENPDYQYRFK